MTAEQMFFPMPVSGLTPVPLADANALLERWGHYLGPVNRPFGSQGWVLDIGGDPVSVAVSCSTVSDRITWIEVRTEGEGDDMEVIAEPRTLPRSQLVELARLCSDPAERWATRPMLRLWREIAAPRWPYWDVTAAIAYSQNARHEGNIYRFDGWAKVNGDSGSSGGGTWSRKRTEADATLGRKTLWMWRYDLTAQDAS